MLLFIDTADCAAIRQAAAWGVISGVTTNPALIAKERRPLHEVIAEIAALVDGPISAEVEASTTTAPDMIREARAIARIHPNLVVKLPMTAEGLKACHACHKEGIRTNMTLVFSAGQALLAARAGASYVSPFIGRLDDIAEDGVALVQDIIRIFAAGSITTRIICASIRHPAHVLSCARAGADIATVPYRVIEQMIHHPLTDQGLAQFQAASLQAGQHG